MAFTKLNCIYAASPSVPAETKTFLVTLVSYMQKCNHQYNVTLFLLSFKRFSADVQHVCTCQSANHMNATVSIPILPPEA